MPKMVVYELFEVDAKSPEDAKEKVSKRSKRDSVIVAAEYLDQLAHPVHLAEAQEMFASAPVAVEEDDG